MHCQGELNGIMFFKVLFTDETTFINYRQINLKGIYTIWKMYDS